MKRPLVGDRVTATLKGTLIAYDCDLGYWTLETDGTDHVPWRMQLHWAQPFEPLPEDWKRGDVVRDDSGNLFTFHDKHGWFGVASNQCSSRGHHERADLADPLVLLVRDGKAVTA